MNRAMNIRTATRAAAAAALTLTAALALSACGGSDAPEGDENQNTPTSSYGEEINGIYYGETETGQYATMTIEVPTITYTQPLCDGGEVGTTVGEMGEPGGEYETRWTTETAPEDQVPVTWLESNDDPSYSGGDVLAGPGASTTMHGVTDTVAENQILFAGQNWTLLDEEGEEIFQAQCAEEAEGIEAEEAEQAEEDAKTAEQHRQRELSENLSDEDWTECTGFRIEDRSEYEFTGLYCEDVEDYID